MYGVPQYYGHSNVHTQPATRYVVPYISQRVVAPTSSIQQSHVVVPASSHVYQYHGSPSAAYSSNYVAYSNGPAANQENQNRNYGNEQQSNSRVNSYSGNYAVEPNANNYNNVNGNNAAAKSAKQIRRPAIEKEFYDIEEKVIIRPAGRAIIELDTPVSQAVKAANGNDNRYQSGFNSPNQNNNYNSNYAPANGVNQRGQYNSAQSGFNDPNQNSNYNVNYAPANGENQRGQYNSAHPGFNNPNQNSNYNANYAPANGENQRGQYNSAQSGFNSPNENTYNSNYAPANGVNQRGQYNSAQAHIECPQDQQGAYHFDVSTPGAQGQYFSTTTTSTPVYIHYQPSSTIASSTQSQFSTTTPHQYSTTGGNQYQPSSSTVGSTRADNQFQSSTPGSNQQDVYVSSTTPVSVTIIENYDDKNKNNQNKQFNNTQDIIYAKNGHLTTPGYHNNNNNNNNGTFYGNEEEDIDQIDDELPPRGDTSRSNNYRADQPDQFYHEPSHSRYTTGPYQPPVKNVQTNYNGEPTERNEYAEEIPVGRYTNQNPTNANSKYTAPDDRQQRLIELYTGNGGVSEVGKSHDAYTDGSNNNNNYYSGSNSNGGSNSQNAAYTNGGNNNNNYYSGSNNNDGKNSQNAAYTNGDNSNYYSGSNSNNNNDGKNGQYKDAGNVRARVISVTPAPDNAVPAEHVNTRRIVVSKYIETVEDVTDASDGTNGNDASNASGSQVNDNKNANGNRNANNNNNNSSPSGYYVSTTPASTSQRIIYVQPVSQEMAEKKAVPPADYRRA